MRPLGKSLVVHTATVALLPEFRIAKAEPLQGGGVRVLEEDGGRTVGGRAVDSSLPTVGRWCQSMPWTAWQ